MKVQWQVRVNEAEATAVHIWFTFGARRFLLLEIMLAIDVAAAEPLTSIIKALLHRSQALLSRSRR